MSENDCVIVFDQNEHGIFFTGQIVTGKAIINFKKPKKLKGIKLQISGYAQCQWREKYGRPRQDFSTKKRKKQTYYGREDYIATTTYLVGSEDTKTFSMDPGTYTYAFACPIPLNCPSSFEGGYGHIRYLAKVVFIRSGASNRTHNVGFTVLRLLDLNHENRLLREPANNEALENFCFFHTKAVHLSVDLQQTGYVPGQIILVSAHVNNMSQVDCKKLIIQLNLRATYISEVPCMHTATDKVCLVKKSCGPVRRQSERRFAETIRVPATPPSSEMLCRNVRVTYEISVTAAMNHLMLNPKATIPITIGNVPLTYATPMPTRAFPDNYPTTSSGYRRENSTLQDDEENLSAIDGDTEDGEDADVDVSLPPPTYEEAMFMTTNIADDDVNIVSDSTRFTPRYPVYDLDSITAANACNKNATSPPPNPPQKRRPRKKKRAPHVEVEKERPPVESPVQI